MSYEHVISQIVKVAVGVGAGTVVIGGLAAFVASA